MDCDALQSQVSWGDRAWSSRFKAAKNSESLRLLQSVIDLADCPMLVGKCFYRCTDFGRITTDFYRKRPDGGSQSETEMGALRIES
jgi:hypothetical protein